ncbi:MULTISPECIES: Hsp20/alpha crystallin family protein [Lactiplantibacillus]|uniref:Hsp20/alpha crystallin family protein n=1 Tax=Lactiplantibacillus TaxID=2767842 RepID=UPI001C1F4376|nr:MULTISPECIES: Hsp20/alpha crystallin family protein [Lactiplantibacillus]MBU7447495.1 Hsp20/alpha crystallin family protein [Lactiplantibacillus sp. 7.2.4]MBU7479700.1 Hsp20/alpha crystallin family protein [Lactiplantibacillus pentosus]
MANTLMNRNDFGMMDPFERLARSFWTPFENMDQVLKTDISETDDQYQVKVDVPGIGKQDVKLDYRDNVLSIKVQKDSFVDHEDEQQNVVMNERHTGTLQRQYMLPNVAADKISASQADGVLTITLPKTQASDDNGTIEIQ